MTHVILYSRNWLCRLILLMLATSPVLAEESSVMVLEGTTASPYDNGDFTVFDRARAWDRTKREEWQISSPDEPPTMEMVQGVIAQARIGPDGTFRLEIDVDKPRTLYFSVLNAKTPEGFTLGSVKMGNNFILEPGELKLRMIASSSSVITGGYYNDAVFNSWRLSDEYKAAQANYQQLILSEDPEAEQARRRHVDAIGEAQDEMLQLEMQGMANVALTHPDPMVRRLTIESTWMYGQWVIEALRGLAELTPEDPWVVKRLAAAEASQENWEKNRQLAVGESVLDFTAETLDGEQVTLADMRANSRYLLVEFWASWCGPCRVEIPHMKQAYTRFRDKGFEIVSFTIDEEYENWEQASVEEEIPWFDLGMGPEAEAPIAYKVSGVPNNYLVESSTGEIIAKNLRQHKLDEKLEELLD